MAWEIKNKHGETTKTGGFLEEADPPKTKEGLTDWSQADPMPEPPHMKYDK